MLFLIDKSRGDVLRKSKSPLVLGQLQTPLTRYAHWGGAFAIDNGAYSGFKEQKFLNMLNNRVKVSHLCLFAVCPDVVGDHESTLLSWHRYKGIIPSCFPKAFVAQDGSDPDSIPWEEIECLFIGGGDPWKDSTMAQWLCLCAKARGKHAHVGRVNTSERYNLFRSLGADTCDGSGVSRYDHMLRNIEIGIGIEPTDLDV